MHSKKIDIKATEFLVTQLAQLIEHLKLFKFFPLLEDILCKKASDLILPETTLFSGFQVVSSNATSTEDVSTNAISTKCKFNYMHFQAILANKISTYFKNWKIATLTLVLE